MKKIANLFLALTLLVATTGVTLNKHYCMGRLKSVAINQSADSCVEKGFTDPMPCCKDVSEELKVEDITKASFHFDSHPDLHLLAVIHFVLLDLTPSYLQDKPSFQYYSPPLPDHDIQVEHQVFLI